MQWINDNDSYSIQIEKYAWTLRYKHYVRGIASTNPNLFRKQYLISKVWRWIGVAIGINYHTGSNGIWCWFSLYALNGWINIKWESGEEYHPGY